MTGKPTAAVIGWPVAHSRSPLIHRFWLDRHGIDGDYLRLAVPPEEVGAYLAAFADSGLVGANVTIPHKETAAAAASDMTETARALGAANTLWLQGGDLQADNTDVAGFLASLDEAAPGWDATDTVLVLGAGGAARAVVQGLLSRGMRRIHVLNRTPARAVKLADRFGDAVLPGGLAELSGHLGSAGLVVNATAAGLNDMASVAIDWQAADPATVAMDLVYVPPVTPFLAAAAARGLVTVDGLGMLLHQAVPGFERWFGVRPSVDAALRRHVLADLGG